MNAKSLPALWQEIMQNGDAFLDAEGQIQGWTHEGMVAIQRRPASTGLPI